MRIVSWFSCGIASAVASKLILGQYPNDEIKIVRCIVDNEHSDNDRFHDDCEKWLGVEIVKLRNPKFKDCWDVWEKRKYISGPRGAPCTTELKKAVRWQFEKEWNPEAQVFGFTKEENKRAIRFKENNFEINLLTPLIDKNISKTDCRELIVGANIELPTMYKLGFSNNNCIGCAKASSSIYWARCRHYFPEQFVRMAELSRRLGCRLVYLKGKRIFLDELPENIDFRKKDKENIECGVLCTE